MLFLAWCCKLNSRITAVELTDSARSLLIHKVILLARMISINEHEASQDRLKRFEEIYRDKMAARPPMEILARYGAMTEAGLLVSEREKADLFLDTHRLNELLYPEKSSTIGMEN